MKTAFETETCSRCHGSGSYSYCQMYGDRCFKCHGAKVVLTKRGVAARAYLDKLCTVLACNLKIGDKVSTTGITLGASVFSYIGTVTEIGIVANPCISSSINGIAQELPKEAVQVTIEHAKYGKVNHIGQLDSKFRTYPVDNAAKIQEALAYQETLTKQGLPRKGKVKAA